MTTYDPKVINQYADRLYFESVRAPIFYSFGSAMVALIVSLGVGLGLDNAGAGIAMGVVLGGLAGFVGYTIGQSAASAMRLTAQQALCQVAIEQRLTSILEQNQAAAEKEKAG